MERKTITKDWLCCEYHKAKVIHGELFVVGGKRFEPRFELSEIEDNSLLDIGIYFLLLDSIVVYVGKSIFSFESRIFAKESFYDGHVNKGWAFNSIKLMPIKPDDNRYLTDRMIKNIEREYIIMFQPYYNSTHRISSLWDGFADWYKSGYADTLNYINDMKFKFATNSLIEKS